jgi:HD-like signal output (HDOD) protein
MRRILFVDDEQYVLEALGDLLRRHRATWDMEFALGGKTALEILRARPCDVVISDMRMPGMDGAELLTRVQREFPHTVRLVLSGHVEPEDAMRTIPVAHQCLSKPCDVALLKNTIERICSVLELVSDDAVRATIGRIGALPARPHVYAAILERLRDPNASNQDIAALLEQDMGMCAKVLNVANSAFFGLPRQVTGISDAVSYLGLRMIGNLTLSLSVFSSDRPVQGVSLESIQRHAMLVGQLARTIAPASISDEAFLAGMLHDVGLLLLASGLPDQFRRTLESVEQQPRPFHVAERELWGVTHAELGAYLIGLWNLPYPIVEAVALHHRPLAARQAGGLSFSVCVAGMLANEVTAAPATIWHPQEQALDEAFLAPAGMGGRLDEWRDAARSRVAEWSEAA